MERVELGKAIRNLEIRDIVHVWVEWEDEPARENPLEWKVKRAVKTEFDQEDSYFSDQTNQRVSTRSDTYEVWFSDPNREDSTLAYVAEYTIHRDGHTVSRRRNPNEKEVDRRGIKRISRIEPTK